MKLTHYLAAAALTSFIFAGCGGPDEKTKDNAGTISPAGKETTDTKEKQENGIDLEQKGDYTRLYSITDECKLSAAELAEAMGFSADKVTEGDNHGKGYCTYIVSYPDGSTNRISISVNDFPLERVRYEIKTNLSSNPSLLSISTSGDTYIYKHLNQGFLQLYNPDHSNLVRVSYGGLANFKGLNDDQKKERSENAYKIVDYLIKKYQD